jgi:hypothetical protein
LNIKGSRKVQVETKNEATIEKQEQYEENVNNIRITQITTKLK